MAWEALPVASVDVSVDVAEVDGEGAGGVYSSGVEVASVGAAVSIASGTVDGGSAAGGGGGL